MKRKKKNNQTRNASSVGFLLSDAYDSFCCAEYTSLDKNPEILTAYRRIADLISSMTIYLMSNTERGDVRIINELSRKIDILPNRYMTRKTFMDIVVMNLLLYGRGNSVVKVHTDGGLLGDLEPVQSYRVGFMPEGYGYKILIDGIRYDPDDVLHFVFSPDPYTPWWGRGLTVALKDVANNLKQARATEKGFMESKWKPSVVVKVDAMIDEFSSPEGRKKLLKDYVESSEAGEPWMIPADQFQVEQIRPLSLADLAINDTVQLDKRTIASIMGVPPFVLGVGEYSKAAWNNFINNTILPIAKSIEQELTRKLILSPKWYVKFNILSLLDWDLTMISNVLGSLSDRGFVTGNEIRDRIGLSPLDGLDELRVLENYIPFDMSGQQKKLLQGAADED